MKKHVFTALIFLISILFVWVYFQKPAQYKVIEIISPDVICIDFNNNSKCDKDEKTRFFGLTTFPEKFSSQSQYIEEKFSIKQENSVVLAVLTKKYLNDNLLNNYVKVEILSEAETPRIAKIYLNDEDFAQNLLENGWAIAFDDSYKIYENFNKIKANINFSKKFNYQLRNKKNGKIHTLDCEYGRKAKDYEIGIFDDDKYKKDYCGYCHESSHYDKPKTPAVYADYKTDNLKIYFLDFVGKYKPDSRCLSEACKLLLQNINDAKVSIDFAIYGLGNVPEIEKAILNAKSKGIKIRYIVDEDSSHQNIYERTNNLKSQLPDFKTDYIEGESSKFINTIMHNKFFIFDNNKIWLGSANVSETDLSGFNANNVIFVKSEELAKIYTDEFEKMYSGEFHTKKKSNGIKTVNIGDTSITAAFSPQDKIITSQLLPIINNAKKSIYIEAFVFTHKTLANSIIAAKNRGVEIKIIVDATNTSPSSSSMVKTLRANGVPVKIENFAGKMHMKTIIVDDDYFIAGSMNLSNSGENYNDENVLFIKNKQINSNAKKFFNYLWANIPDKYLKQYVRAESKESIGSCSDGIDNDYDGKSDSQDDGCK
ncbi:hypothetical protein IJS77_01430 [bacterium]|nr:hypothetical protein [bacterium]